MSTRTTDTPPASTSEGTPAPAAALEIVQVDPGSLLVDVNVRTDLQLDKAFLASIAELGVLVPIVALRTAEDQLRVRYGHRRTLAAVQVGRPTVSVVIAGPEVAGDDTGAQVERIIGQVHENDRRASLTVGDQVRAAEQLTAFGLSAAQIVKRGVGDKAAVGQALAVADSTLARKAADRYAFLTLEQAAVLADFEREPEILKVLVAAAKDSPGRFNHAAQRAYDDRAEAQRRADLVETLTKAGVRIIDNPGYNNRTIKALSDLRGAKPGKGITPAAHAKCPGHAAFISRSFRGDLGEVYVCTDWSKNGHTDRYSSRPAPSQPTSEAAQETARAERREVIDNNKAWASAEAVRRRFLQTYLARKTAEKGSAAFVAGELARGSHELRRAMEGRSSLLCELLGCPKRADLPALVAQASEARAQVLGLAVVLASLEESVTRDAWRHPDRVRQAVLHLPVRARLPALRRRGPSHRPQEEGDPHRCRRPGCYGDRLDHHRRRAADRSGRGRSVTAAQGRLSPAELDDELQAGVDLELGHPRSRVDAGTQAMRDKRAVHAIAEALREPEWDSILLEEIVQILRDTGRTVGPPPLAVYRG